MYIPNLFLFCCCCCYFCLFVFFSVTLKYVIWIKYLKLRFILGGKDSGGWMLPLGLTFFLFILREQRKRMKALQHWTLITTEKYNSNFSSTINQNFFAFYLSDDVTDIWDNFHEGEHKTSWHANLDHHLTNSLVSCLLLAATYNSVKTRHCWESWTPRMSLGHSHLCSHKGWNSSRQTQPQIWWRYRQVKCTKHFHGTGQQIVGDQFLPTLSSWAAFP